MRPDQVVVGSPALDDVACLSQAGEPMQVHAVLAELAVEAFREGILRRLSALYEAQSHTCSLSSQEHRLGGELRAIVQNQGPGQWPSCSEFIEVSGQAGAGDPRVNDLADVLAGEVFDEVEDPEPPAIGELIGQEVRGPAFVGLGRHRHRHSGPRDLLAALGAHLPAFLAVESVRALAVDDPAFPLEHLVQRQIAVAGIALGQNL